MTVAPPRLAGELEICQRRAGEGEAAIGAEALVQRRRRRGRARSRELHDELRGAAQVVRRAPRVWRQRPRGAVEQQLLRAHDRRRGEPRQVAAAVVAARLPGLLGSCDLRGLGGRVEQDRADVDGRDPVDERVVHLRQQRDAPAAQALDHGQLPQRARAVQAARQLLADELGERGVAARGGQRCAAHMPAEVEAVVVDPHGVRKPRGAGLQALAIARHEVQPPADALEHPVVAHPVAVCEQQQAADRHVDRPVLGGQRGAVGRCELLAHANGPIAQRGAIRSAPSRRMTSPLTIVLRTISQASPANSCGCPSRGG